MINAFSADLVSAPPLQGRVEAKQQRPFGSKGLVQQLQQDPTERQRRPLRAIEHAVIILEMGIVTFPHDSQTGGYGALADGKNRPGQQDLRIFPNGLGKKRSKLYDEWQQLDRQCSHIEDVFWRKILL